MVGRSNKLIHHALWFSTDLLWLPGNKVGHMRWNAFSLRRHITWDICYDVQGNQTNLAGEREGGRWDGREGNEGGEREGGRKTMGQLGTIGAHHEAISYTSETRHNVCIP